MGNDRQALRVDVTEVAVQGPEITVYWRDEVLLRGAVVAEPGARDVAVRLTEDGEAVCIEVTVGPAPGEAVTAAWLEFGWVATTVGTVRAWVPHLCPEPDDVAADHAFRSPVGAIEDRRARVILLPDIQLLAAERALPAAFVANLRLTPPRVSYGLCASRPRPHVFFQRDRSGGTMRAVRFGLRVIAESAGEAALESSCARRVWRFVGAEQAERAAPQALPFAEHARRGYDAVADEWVDTEVNGTSAGGPLLFNDSGTATFFQAWYNALRSAIGLALLGRRLASEEYLRRARQIVALADALPEGELWPTFYDHERRRWWGVGEDFVFAWVTRDPELLRFYHLADVCETAHWMLAWHHLVEPHAGFAHRVRRLARFLAAVQAEDGAIPSYFAVDGLLPRPQLQRVAQCAVAGPVLVYGQQRAAAARLADFLCRAVVPTREYFDYETFLSCSYKAPGFADPHTGIPPQSTLAMLWTARCLLDCTRNAVGTEEQRQRWLEGARRAVDQLCLYQQMWEPPFLSYRGFGGFGVMNSDGEWSDARQSLCALVLCDASRAFGEPEYFRRGVAALRAGFALQAVPENRAICPTVFDGACPNWPRGSDWEFRWERPAAEMARMPAGKSIENYGHGGYDSPGTRSSFDWGEGSAAACALMATEQYGDVCIDRRTRQVYGIDGVTAIVEPGGFRLVSSVGADRALRVCTLDAGKGTRAAPPLVVRPGALVRIEDRQLSGATAPNGGA
jgi:hypothetical protein